MLTAPVRFVRWSAAAVALGALLVAAAPAPGQTPEQPDRRPIIAVMYFTNGSLLDHDRYEPLRKGISEMLVHTLNQNPDIRVVERDQLQLILEEQGLHTNPRIDQETAVRIGKVLGAGHMLMGGFVIEEDRDMRIGLRAVNVETSALDFSTEVNGKANDILNLISELGRSTNSGLRLPPLRQAAQPRRSSVSPAEQYRAFELVSRSIEEQDKRNFESAIGLLREALQIYPEFERAKFRLAQLERVSGGR